jgi:hypothetical protein
VDKLPEALGMGELGADLVVFIYEAVHSGINIRAGRAVRIEGGGVSRSHVHSAAILRALEGMGYVTDEMDAAGLAEGGGREADIREVIGNGRHGAHAEDRKGGDAAQESRRGKEDGAHQATGFGLACLQMSISDAM